MPGGVDCNSIRTEAERRMTVLIALSTKWRRHMLKEFKEFAMRGNVVDMAVGIIIGGAFGTIVKSLVDDVLMPPLGLLLGGVDFSNFFLVLKEGTTAGPYASVSSAKAA